MNEPVKESYLVSTTADADQYHVVRVFHGGGLGAQVVCRAVSLEWAGRIANALQVQRDARKP